MCTIGNEFYLTLRLCVCLGVSVLLCLIYECADISECRKLSWGLRNFSWTWLIHVGDMTHSCVRHDSLVVSHVSHKSESCLLHEWVMSYVWMHGYLGMQQAVYAAEEFLMCEWVLSRRWMSRVTCIIWYNMYTYIICIIAQTCRDTAQLAAFRDIRAFIYETWLIDRWDMTHSCMRHDAFMNDMGHDSFIYETRLICMW